MIFLVYCIYCFIVLLFVLSPAPTVALRDYILLLWRDIAYLC